MDYTIEQANKLFNEDKIDSDTRDVIIAYLEANQVYYSAGDVLKKHFQMLYKLDIEKATNKDELQEIKEKLRVMPESVAKVFLFRDIIIKEENIKQH